MYIHEALQQLTIEKPYIRRQSWARWSNEFPGRGVCIQPTNSPDGCIVESDVDKGDRRRWNPTADDLIADDWEVTDL